MIDFVVENTLMGAALEFSCKCLCFSIWKEREEKIDATAEWIVVEIFFHKVVSVEIVDDFSFSPVRRWSFFGNTLAFRACASRSSFEFCSSPLRIFHLKLCERMVDCHVRVTSFRQPILGRRHENLTVCTAIFARRTKMIPTLEFDVRIPTHASENVSLLARYYLHDLWRGNCRFLERNPSHPKSTEITGGLGCKSSKLSIREGPERCRNVKISNSTS